MDENEEYLIYAVSNWEDDKFPHIYFAQLTTDMYGRRHILIHAHTDDQEEILIACLICRLYVEVPVRMHEMASMNFIGFHSITYNGSLIKVDVN